MNFIVKDNNPKSRKESWLSPTNLPPKNPSLIMFILYATTLINQRTWIVPKQVL